MFCPSSLGSRRPFAEGSSANCAAQHYELIPQSTLAAAEASLRDEIGPFISNLLDRVDKQLERQARRIETLKARAELQAGRLSQGPDGFGDRPGSSSAAAGSGRDGRTDGKGRGAAGRKTLDGEAALRARMTRQKKEALQYSVERLEMEVAQKERELRIRLEKAS
jgi:DASH complex subunit SPC19